jgi:adenosylmethionine-8-amino-7-oxononanoate aminotransferase
MQVTPAPPCRDLGHSDPDVLAAMHKQLDQLAYGTAGRCGMTTTVMRFSFARARTSFLTSQVVKNWLMIS